MRHIIWIYAVCKSNISPFFFSGGGGGLVLTLTAPSKNCMRRHFNFYSYLSKKIRLDFSCESQRIHLKHQVLFSLKNNEKIFMNVVCCSRDWRFKG